MTEERKAILIGVDRYETLPSLAAPGRDAEALAEVLEQPSIGAFQVKTLHDPVYSKTVRVLADVLNGADKSDTILIYFSGHGMWRDQELYLCTTDTDPDRAFSTAISARWLSESINNSLSQHVLLIMDLCQSGAVSRPGRFNDLAGSLRGTSGTVLASSNAGLMAVEDLQDQSNRGDRSSAFTRALIDGLWRGNADLDGDGHISVSELYEYVRHRIDEVSDTSTKDLLMLRGMDNVQIAMSGRLTLIARERDHSSVYQRQDYEREQADLDTRFDEITRPLRLPESEFQARKSQFPLRELWEAFTDGIGSVFGLIVSRTVRSQNRQSAWTNLSQRLTEKYEQLDSTIETNPRSEQNQLPSDPADERGDGS